MKLHSTLVAVSAAALLSACASSGYEPNKTRDTAVGAAAGAAIGALAHGSNRTHGALAGAAIGALGGNIWSKRMEQQKQAMEQATRGTGVEVSQTADNRLKLAIPSDVSFDTGRSDIKPNFQPVLQRFATTLNENPATNVVIIGHTDNTGSPSINQPLWVDPRSAHPRLPGRPWRESCWRITIEGRGEREPVAANTRPTPGAHATAASRSTWPRPHRPSPRQRQRAEGP